MDEKELKLLWESLSKDFDIGDFDYFKSKMSDESGRKKFYDAFSSDVDGAKALKSVNPKFSDFSQFNVYVGGLKKKEPAVSGQPSVVSGSTSPSPSQFQLPSVDPAKEPEDNLYDLNQAVTKEADNVYAQSQAKINLLTKDYEDYVAQLNQQIKDGVIDNFTAQGLLGHKKKRVDKEMEAANAAYQQAIEQLNGKSQEERKKILNPKNRKTSIEVGVTSSEGENAALLNEIYDLTKELDSLEDGSKDKERISQALKQKKTQLSGRLGIPEEGLEPAIAGQIYSNTIGKAPNPQEIREYEVGIKEAPVNTSSTQQRRKSGQLFYENLYDYYQKNPKAASNAFSQTFMDLPDETGARKPSQYDFEMVDFMIKNGKEAVRDEQGVLYVPEGAKDVDVKALQSQYVRNLKGLSQQTTENFIKLTPSSDDRAKLESGAMSQEAFNKKYNYENITKNLQKQLDLVNQYVLDDKDKSQISDYVKNSYTYIADVTGRFGGKEYREKNPLYAGLNDYQKIYLENLRVSNPEKYENRLRLLTTPPELVKQETGTWNPELQMGYEKMMKEAEDDGIQLSELDYLSRIENLVSKDKRGELDAEGKLELTELMSQYDELQKFKNSQIDRYPAAAKQEIIDNIGRATGDTELGLGGRFVYGVGSGISTGVDWLYEKITAPFSDEDSRISDLETIGNDELYQSKMNKGWEDEGVVEGLYKYAIDPEFKKQVDAIDADEKLNQQQKYDAKVAAFEKYRKDKGESPVVITKNPDAGDVNLSATAILNTTSDVAQQILSQLALAYITGGLGNVSKVRSLATLFGTTFATTIDRYEAEALKEGRTNATSYAIRKATIDALTELYGDDLMQVKNLFKGKGAVGKIINSVTEAEWKAVLSARKGLFNKVKNVVGQIPKKVLKPALTETFEEGTAQILNQALDGKDLFDGMKETLVTTAVGTIGTFLTGLPFAFRSINNSQKVKLYNAGINADKYLASVKSQLDNGQIDAKEAQKRELVINDIKNIVDNMVKVDENGKPLSDQKLIDLAFNKYVELQAQKAKKENPKSAKLDQVVDELQDENAQILSGEVVPEVPKAAGEVAPEVQKFGIGFAPFREKNVLTEEEDVDIRNSPDYKLHQENVQKVAEGLGIKINNKLDTWGGYVDFQTGRPVQEVSNMMEIEATPQQARLMAAILGKAAPEMQDSILVGNYSEKGAGLQHTVKTGSFANAQEALKLLKDNGLEYFSVDKNTGDVIIIDQKSTDTPKIINLVKQLNENGIPAKHKFGKVDAEFVDSGQYDRIIEAERGRVGAETGFDIDAFVQEAAGKYDAIKAARTEPVVPQPLKDVESTTKALDELSETDLEDKILPSVTNVYKLQDGTAERILERSFKPNRVWVYKIENAGDIIRELSKYKNQFLDPSYIYEKVNKLEKFLKQQKDQSKVSPDDSYFQFKRQNEESVNDFIRSYEELPVMSEAQSVAKKMVLDLLSGNIDEAQKGIDYFNDIRAADNIRAELKKRNKYQISEAYHKAKKDGSNPELVKAVEDLLGGEAVPEAKAEVTETQKSIADKIRGLKIDLSKLGGGGAQSNIAGLPVALYNTVVEAVALAVEAGVSVNKAISDAIKQYKLDKNKDFDKDVFAREVLKGIEITEPEASPIYFENLKKFASESSFDNKIQFKNAIQNLFVKYLPELKKKFGKDFDPSKYDERARKYLVDLVTKESLNAIKKHPEAIGWYDEKTQSALDVISAIHPEIATDAEARGAFILPLAIMSNGNKVDFNFELAEKQYQFFKENGRFNPDGEFGLQQSGIKKSLMLINSLLDNGLTMSDINKFLTSKYRAGDLKIKIDGKVKDLASGELADEQVYGAVILGPKIGNGFYMNLWGQFDQLTMDRWFMRTWGRMTGTLIEKDAAGIAEGKKRLSNALDEIKKDFEALAILKSLLPKISSLSMQDLAKSIEKVSMDKNKRAKLSSNPKTDELRKAANSLSKNLSGEKEAPSTGKERRFIREVFSDVVNDLKSKYGIEISMADLQAALWYPEKILYESFKGGETFEAAAEGYTSDSAPDYLNAAKKLATKLGVNEEQINQALSRGRQRAERVAGEGYPEGGRAISESYQDILGRVKEAIGEKPATEKVRAAAKTVRSLKIKQQGLQSNIAGVPIALYNAALETIALAMEAGASLKDAIDQAVQKHKLNKQKGFNAEQFIKPLEDATGQTYPKIGGEYVVQIEAAGEVPVQPEAGVGEEMEGGVPPTEPPKPPKEGEVEGEEGEVTRKPSGIKKGLVSQEILSKMNLEKVGDKELLESGRKIIDSGEVNPPSLVNKILDEGKGVLTPAEVVALITYKADLDNKQEDLAKEIGKREASGEDLGTLLADMKTLQTEIDNFDMAAVITAQQQSMSFRLRRYMLDRSYNITVQIEKYKRANNGVIPAEVEKKFREMDAQIKELDKKLKEAEASKYDQEGKAAMENIIEDVQREQANGPVLYTEAELEEKIQKGVQAEIDKIYSAMPTPKRSAAQRAITALENIQKKLRSKTYDASLGIPVAFIDAGITAIKNAIKLGIEVEKAVEIGIKTIKDKLQGKAWAKEDDFRKDMIDGFKAEGVSIKAKKTEPKINDDGTVTIPNQLIRDLVAQGITDIDDLANAVRKIVEPQLPGVTNRQVRDYITKYGKEVNPTRDDLTIKMNTAKRIGRLLSRLEDMQKMGAAVYMIKYRTQKPSGNKLTQKEQELKKLINQLEKDAIGSDEILKKIQEQKDLDAAKAAIRRRIDELSDKIARNDFSKKAKKQVPADQELRDLQSEKEKVKEEYDKAQYEAEQKNKSLGRKINDALNELLVGLARTLVTGFDFGVVLTQGVIKFYRNPVMSAKAFAEGMRQFSSESRQKKFENELRASGAYELIKNSGLAVSVGEERASVQEQIFIANYVNIIWNTLATIVTFNHKRSKEFVKALNPFKASQRFMDAYLNYIRINTFLDISSSISKDGYPPEVDPDLHKAAAEWVNTTTMKGAKNIPRGLGFLMFSASKVAAELKLFSPLVFAYYAQMPAPLRKRAVLDYGKFALSFLAVTSLMRAALGDDDDDDFWDITSSNFLTFKFGDQRLSFAAGIRPMLVFWGRLFTGRYVDQYGEVSKLGERPGKDVNTKGDLIFRFFISKFAPVPAAVWSKLDERAGREVEDDVLITKLVVPMWLQDSKELYENNPREIGALYTMLSLIGANVRTVESPFKKEQKVGKTITYTDEYSRKRKIELNEEQHKEYQRIFDEIYAKNIEEIKKSSSYKNKSGEQKITFESAFSRKAKSDAESDAQKLLEKIYKNEFKKFPIIRETPEEKEVNRILNRGEKR